MTRNQRITALVLLASINAFGFIDRVMIALVAEKIKAEFQVSDLQIGLLGGTAFAVVNALAAVPIARMAERFYRSYVTAGFLLMASVFTTLAGATASFAQLFACRLGMAAGNAATEAPPHSMISDMYPKEKRASAISIFMLGVPLAALFGSFLGGSIAESFGWRNTFVFFGVGGAIISLLCFLFLKEPQRGASDGAASEALSTIGVVRILLGSSSLRWLVIALSTISLGSFGVNTFLPAFFSRDYGLDAGQAGFVFGLISGIGALIGTLFGGYASEWMARRDPRWLLGVPALGLVLGAPLFVAGLLSGNLYVAVPVMLIGSAAFYTAMGPSIATLHGSFSAHSRATGSAVFLLIIHLLGQGLGPPLVGVVSDTVSAAMYTGGNFASECAGAAAQIEGSACARASADGLRYAIGTFALFFVGAGGLLYLAARAGWKTVARTAGA